ncbi:MAG: SagB/ThcOx family dehydrogenase [Candidatus Omnitrophica bacterium]|nr:SagB/ThcOx family dehydrogenase [Candidatus Omnitrophota bacterium]
MKNISLHTYVSMFIVQVVIVNCVYALDKGESILLYPTVRKNAMSVEETIKKRRSVRSYTGGKITLNDVSQLLYYANGITHREPPFGGFRAAPSAGATYPIELYVVSNMIDGLEDALYWYDVEKNTLEKKKKGNFVQAIAERSYGQQFIANAQVIILMTAVWQRTTGRYGERGRRYVILDAGHIGENIYLEATSLNLAPCAVGAFDDEQINDFLDIDGQRESCIYIMVVGK